MFSNAPIFQFVRFTLFCDMIRCSLFIACITVSCSAVAQFSFGLKAGVNYSRVIQKNDTSNWTGFGFAPGLHLGAYSRLSVNEKVELGAEFVFSGKGYRDKQSNNKSHLLYINIPIILDLKITDRLALQLGPEVGFLIASWGKNDDYLSAIYTNRFEFGALAGIRYKLNDSFNLGLRFEQGLSNMIGRDASTLQYRYLPGGDPIIIGQNLREAGWVHHNQNFQLTLEYRLFTR
jgi:hypothetical protein